MKAKKAAKRLRRVETALADVIDQFSTIEPTVRDLLVSAKVSVVRAKEKMSVEPPPSNVKKAPVKAEKAHLTAAGRKKISLAAKRRWAAAKRKGVNAVTGRPLSKTA